jgi:protein phosphatase
MNQHGSNFESGAATHTGKVRSVNEDAYLVHPQSGVWAVADGMGGHEAGALASATVVEALQSLGEPASATDLVSRCQSRLARANARLLEIGEARGGIVIGTTIAVFLACEGYFSCLWSGDSRVYLVRGQKISQISRDHTEVAELLAEGILTEDEARTWPRRNVITRAIGVTHDLELEIAKGVLEKNDIFILCSDGLTAHVSDREILEFSMTSCPQTACDALVALTLERGASDNVTVLIVRYAPRGPTLLLT